MTENECSLLLSTANEMAANSKAMKIFSLAFQFLLNTGLRSGELRSLTWDDVDVNSGLIHIRAKPGWTPKTYARSFYLNSVSLAIIRGLEKTGLFVFVSPTGKQLAKDDLRNALIRTTNKAGIAGFTRVHDLRHTFSSQMQMKGVDPGTVATILGHKGLETTAIYTHQTAEHLKASIERVSTQGAT